MFLKLFFKRKRAVNLLLHSIKLLVEPSLAIFCDVDIIHQSQCNSKKSRTNSQESCAAATYSHGETWADTVEHAFKRVCNVFGFDSLNTHQKEYINYIVL